MKLSNSDSGNIKYYNCYCNTHTNIFPRPLLLSSTKDGCRHSTSAIFAFIFCVQHTLLFISFSTFPGPCTAVSLLRLGLPFCDRQKLHLSLCSLLSLSCCPASFRSHNLSTASPPTIATNNTISFYYNTTIPLSPLSIVLNNDHKEETASPSSRHRLRFMLTRKILSFTTNYLPS